MAVGESECYFLCVTCLAAAFDNEWASAKLKWNWNKTEITRLKRFTTVSAFCFSVSVHMCDGWIKTLFYFSFIPTVRALYCVSDRRFWQTIIAFFRVVVTYSTTVAKYSYSARTSALFMITMARASDRRKWCEYPLKIADAILLLKVSRMYRFTSSARETGSQCVREAQTPRFVRRNPRRMARDEIEKPTNETDDVQRRRRGAPHFDRRGSARATLCWAEMACVVGREGATLLGRAKARRDGRVRDREATPVPPSWSVQSTKHRCTQRSASTTFPVRHVISNGRAYGNILSLFNEHWIIVHCSNLRTKKLLYPAVERMGFDENSDVRAADAIYKSATAAKGNEWRVDCLVVGLEFGWELLIVC